jgi:hypothetical protein
MPVELMANVPLRSLPMKVIHGLKDDILTALNTYKDWVLSSQTQEHLRTYGITRVGPIPGEGSEDHFASAEHLKQINHAHHLGPPTEQYGINLNYNGAIEKFAHRMNPIFFEDIRTRNNLLDDELQYSLGARFCALKMYYPENGYIGWHTNWDLPGYNIIFTYSPTGNGYWRHIDSTDSKTVTPDLEKLVHIEDVSGWHCKAGYFGPKSELNRVVWHSAFAREQRITVSYVLQNKAIWDDVVAELEG